MTTAEAYEIAAAWHDKQAAGCREIANDVPRIGPDARAKAAVAAVHHAGSAAGLRISASGLRRKEMRL